MEKGFFHCSLKAFNRSKGPSSCGKAAYRAGEKIEDHRTGETYDYRRKKGIEFAELTLPGGQEISRQDFWNSVEVNFTKDNAVTSRECEIAIPHQLSDKGKNRAARNMAKAIREKYNVATDLARHRPTNDMRQKEYGDPRNHHSHILYSACEILKDGSLGNKVVELDPIACKKRKPGGSKYEDPAEWMRDTWERVCNAELEREGLDIRIDRRTLVAQGIDRVATMHEGPTATNMERQGKETERGQLNKEIEKINQRIAQLQQAEKLLAQIEKDISAKPPKATQPKRYKQALDYMVKNETTGEFRWQNSQAIALLDHGYKNMITVSSSSEANCKAALQLGLQKGWTKFDVSGGDKDFHTEMFRQARLLGIPADSIKCDLTDQEREAIEQALGDKPLIAELRKEIERIKAGIEERDQLSTWLQQPELAEKDALKMANKERNPEIKRIEREYLELKKEAKQVVDQYKTKLGQYQDRSFASKTLAGGDRKELQKLAERVELIDSKVKILLREHGAELKNSHTDLKGRAAQLIQENRSERADAFQKLKTLPNSGDLHQAEKRLSQVPEIKDQAEASQLARMQAEVQRLCLEQKRRQQQDNESNVFKPR
ncbi:MobA/MobL family protein [Desulfuromonas acetoxidans]|uniref:MobA/MobL protein n=1 Tax=Desulfuromonas acetoxidans (strain DSM 684 / 11070) TaxID=281689 RepID=Q1K2Y7_DESA6|nr:MobA/MobL family protein [Desulfuromonas acetoxidans]EAT16744.1 MobA/MobL protein [Desulfuromonas acetoxidans DSM 684]NVD23685.1 MobA/MobL family protein [Desulfuromonas acetoxidans]NVE15930.1 MobA/MobL family protein [Desulfuromonas acetoxidans]